MATPRTIKDNKVHKAVEIKDASQTERAFIPQKIKRFPVAPVTMSLEHIQTALRLRGTPPHEDTVFIAIDFEQWEINPDLVTEIGVAILDTKDLKALDPPTTAANLNAQLRYAHYRVAERQDKVNHKYVKGCPENFVFGETKLIKLDEAGILLSRIFSDPSKLHEAHIPEMPITNAKRNVILIGHSLKNDTRTAAKLGFTPINVVAQADTQRLLTGLSKKQIPSLTSLLLAVGIMPRYLHNAGNDAAFTMQAMIEMAVQELRRPGLIAAAILAERAKSNDKNRINASTDDSTKTAGERDS